MSRPQPSFSIRADVANPGQFFACCGLLELAHRMWTNVEGWFEMHYFCVSMPSRSATLRDVIDHLLNVGASQGRTSGVIRDSRGNPVDLDKVTPIELGDPINIRLAWWLDEFKSAFTPFKLWSGRQSSWDVFCQLRKAGRLCKSVDERLFDVSTPLKSRFGLDPRSAWEALDTGFSPNTLGMSVATYWATELLAAIALASFVVDQSSSQLSYATWPRPLPTPVARIAAAGILPLTGQQHFEFRLVRRGSFDGFGYAYSMGGDL